MDIVVKEELKAYIDPLTADEHEALERSLLAEGCRDALVLWGNILVDGHNRHGICTRHGIPFETVQNPRFTSMEDVYLWMIEQHLGRRSVSDYQRGVLALRKREILARRRHGARPDEARGQTPAAATDDAPPWDEAPPASRAELAREARLSAHQVGMIERIHAHAAPEVVEAVRTGELSISAAAAVATLSEDEQRAAAQGGKAELKQVARRVRDARKRHKGDEAAPGGTDEAAAPDAKALQRRVSELERENELLRKQVSTLQELLQRQRG